MKVATYLTWLLAVFSVALLYRERGILDGRQHALEVLDRQKKDLVGEIVTFSAELAELGRRKSNVLVQLQEKIEPGKHNASSSPSALERAITSDPQFQELAIAATRASLKRRYAAFYSAIELPSPAQAKFEAALSNYQQQMLDLYGALRTLGYDRDSEVAKFFRTKIDAELKATETEILGEDGRRRLDEYTRLAPIRESIERFSGLAAIAGSALTTAQIDTLVRAASAASGVPGQGQQITLNSVPWDSFLQTGSDILSPIQMQMLSTYLQQMRALEYFKKLSRAKPASS